MQWRMLFATMIGYTLFYFMRKNFSFAMPGLQQDCGISKSMLGNFLFWGGIVYGLSKFLNGIIGDKVNPRRMLCFGLLACTLVNVAFGFAPLVATSPSSLAWTFGILLVVNQFFQGTGFPPCAKLIAFWIPPRELATKMSVWNTSHSIGGGLVAKICGVIMGLGAIGAANQGVGMWRWCFWSMAVLGFLGLVLMIFWLPGTPKEEGLPDLSGTDVAREKRQECRFPEEKGQVGEATLLSLHDQPSMARMVFLNPVIWMLGFINFTINAVRALIADWGPTMLQEAKGFDPGSTGTVIMLFEFAGIAGMLFAGWATDRFFGGRAPRLCVFLMALTAGLLAAFWFLPAGVAGATARRGGAVPWGLLPLWAAGADRRHGDQHLDKALRRHVHRLHLPLLLRRGVRRGQGLRQPCAVVWRLEASAARHGRDCRCRRGCVSLSLVRPRQRLCDFRHKPRKRCVIHRRAGELTRTPLPKFFYQLFQETCHLYKQTLKLL